jgi:hypothetical protein
MDVTKIPRMPHCKGGYMCERNDGEIENPESGIAKRDSSDTRVEKLKRWPPILRSIRASLTKKKEKRKKKWTMYHNSP